MTAIPLKMLHSYQFYMLFLEKAKDALDQYMLAVRYWQNGTYHSALGDNRKETEKEAIIDELFKRSYNLVAAEPEKYMFKSFPFMYMHLEKDS